jgi:hypothetical protein
MSGFQEDQNVDFSVDKKNLYRQEVVTDLKVASIIKFDPIKPDGMADDSRTAIFMGQSQVILPEGPTPIQARLEANNMEEALNSFPDAMKLAMNQVMSQMAERVIQRQQPESMSQKNGSKIIKPGK